MTSSQPKSKNIDGEIEVSIVMPCLNEEETLQGCLDEAKAAIDAAGARGEIVVADNGSTDRSAEIATNAGATLVSVEKKGYGNALIAGIQAARGTYVLMGDADGSYDFGSLGGFLKKLKDGNDLVMGCRLPSGGGVIEPGAMPWKHRWIGNPVLSWLGKLFFKAPVDDFHCGLRAFRREAVLAANLQCSGMEFASEMVVKLIIAGAKITQIPIVLRPDGRTRAPHLQSWRDGWRHLRFMLLFSPRWLFLIPGLIVFVIGTLGFFTLLTGPKTVGGVTFDTNTLLVFAMSMLLGAQSMFFAVYTKAFAEFSGLLKPDPRIRKLLESRLVEWGIGIGLLFMVGGTLYLFVAFSQWRDVGFGAMSYPDSLRIVIPSVTAFSLGTQVIFYGFALAIFGLTRR